MVKYMNGQMYGNKLLEMKEMKNLQARTKRIKCRGVVRSEMQEV